ncbi:acetyltransferase [Paenibacillus sp. HB172176]|uniref:acetyltransferase n=1 Tax=Paenibacillus sp. HB172176 TaxID=2493690 RepID=UPI00143B5574|nr:acetyltransferase [Paenibacillus sp. HB172176]
MINIVVIGAGGHAKAAIHVIESTAKYHIIGLIDSGRSIGDIVYGYKVLGNEDWLRQYGQSVDGLFIAVGDNWVRAEIAARLKANCDPLPPFITAVHPSAHIARGACIGAGSVIMAGAIMNSDARIGEHCVLYPGASIDHDSEAGSFVSLAPKAATGGSVRIGSYTAIGLGANIIHNITIGEHCVIGAGSTLVRSLPDRALAYGLPAKLIRTREAGEKYL